MIPVPLRAAAASAESARRLLLDLFFPLRCGACGGPCASLFCEACTAVIGRGDDPFCVVCLGERRDPFACRAHERTGAAWGVFEGTLRSLVLALKYDARPRAAAQLAEGIASAPGARALLMRADLLVPVPPDPGRRRARGYHPATWLAEALGRAAGRPVAPDLLARVRGGPSQTKVSPEERRRNVAHAFAAAVPALASGRRVLLVDDVVTTGSTATACLEACAGAGAAWTGIVAAARAFERARISEGLSFLQDR